MFRSLFGTRTKSRQDLARVSKLGCEELHDRIVPSANLLVNEVFVNPDGSNDIGKEYIELRVNGTPDFTNTYVVAIEGEEGGTNSNDSGSVDQKIKLSDYVNLTTLGSRQYIVIADTSSTLTTDANKFVIKVSGPGGTPFTLENGSMSVAVLQTATSLVAGDVGTATDLDADDNGVIDATVGGNSVALYDAVGYNEDPNDHPNDRVYGFNITPSGSSPPDADVMIRDQDYNESYSDYLAGGSTTNYAVNGWFGAEIESDNVTVDTIIFGAASPASEAPDVITPGAMNDE